MLKFLLTLIAVIFLLRLLIGLLAGSFQVYIVKHYHEQAPRDHKRQPEGKVTIDTGTGAKPRKYSDTEGEYTDYEEIS